MKKISKLFTVCCFVVSISAHTQGNLDCEFNFREALFYLEGDKNFKKDSLKSIEYLKPCLIKGDAKAQLLMGKLYNAKGNEESYLKAFKLFKKAAKQGNVIAMTDLAVLYKYGRGCDLNFNKARRWFKKAAELGNDKASYSLGYLYLKGFGSITQDYTKAIKWFEKSKYPMAKYWLGSCYYYGYGVEKDLQKANELLGANFEIVEVSNTVINTSENINNTLFNETVESESIVNDEVITKANLIGKWQGTLLKYDWSGKNIEQKHIINIQFDVDSISQSLKYRFDIENQEVSGNTLQYDDFLYFDDTEIKLPHTNFNEAIPNELIYQLLSSDLNVKYFSDVPYLIGNLDSYIPFFNEAGAPLKMILKKTEKFENSNEELSDDILQALAEQEDSFIKLYPNPFQDDLIISYKLENTNFVEVSVTNINGTKRNIIEKRIEQKAGQYRYFFDGTNLEKGLYLVTILLDTEKKTRLIVKK